MLNAQISSWGVAEAMRIVSWFHMGEVKVMSEGIDLSAVAEASPLSRRLPVASVLLSALCALWLLIATTTDACAASQSCPLPRHPVASADEASARVVQAIDAYQLLRPYRLSLDCAMLIPDQDRKSSMYTVEIHERHDALCGGDPISAPRVMSVNVMPDGRMTTDSYDHETDRPLRCPAHGASTPQEVVYDFYRWYLGQDRATHDPIFQSRKQIAHYVSRILLRRADMNAWTCDYDYFTQAQGFDPVWVNTVVPEQTHIRGNKAKVGLTLGLRAIDARVAKLTVTLRKEDGAWKIIDVHDDYPEHWDIENKAREQAEAQQEAQQKAQQQAQH